MTDILQHLRVGLHVEADDLIDEIERNRAAIAELVGHLEWAMSQPAMSYSCRIKNQNTAWCDKIDAARAAINKHNPTIKDK